MAGINGASTMMEWDLKEPLTLDSGKYELWYNEDMTSGTEADNFAGHACYDVEFSGFVGHHSNKCHSLSQVEIEADTPGWDNNYGYTCSSYASKGWCKNG